MGDLTIKNTRGTLGTLGDKLQNVPGTKGGTTVDTPLKGVPVSPRAVPTQP